MTEKQHDLKNWLLQVQKMLHDGARSLDPETVARLREARERALGSATSKSTHPRGATLGWAALLAGVVATVWFGLPQTQRDVTQALEDVVLLSNDEDIDFYQNIEFVRWLTAGAPDGN